jgi:hypothetical protein
MCPFLLQTLCTQRMRYNGKTTIRNSKFVVKDDKLSAFGFSFGANDNSVSQPVSPKNASTLVSATPSSPSTHKFMDTWKFNRPWLQYDPKSKLMFCDICVSAQVGSWLSKLAPENGTWWFTYNFESGPSKYHFNSNF